MQWIAPGSELTFSYGRQLVSKYKFSVARGQIMVAKNSPWRLGNVQLVLIVAVVEVYLQEDLFHF